VTPAEPAGVGTSAPVPPLARRPAADAAAERDLAGRRIAEFAVIVVAAIWAANFIVVKVATTVFPPIGFSFLRFSLAAVLLLVLLRVLEGGIRLPSRELCRIAILGGVGFALYQMLWTPALGAIPAGDSALLIAATPVIAVVIAGLIGTDRLTPLKLGGALVSFAGVGFVVAAGSGLEFGGQLGGQLLTLGAAACWAVYTAFAVTILRTNTPLRTTAWAVTAGSIGMAPIGLAQLAQLDWATVPAEAWAGFLFSALLPAGLTNVVIFAAVRRLGPARVTIYQFLVPAFAVLMGALFLAEPIRPGQLLGGAIIVFGIVLARREAFWRLRPERILARPG
jgi:drug/metabolite transporter (DMT)-like permease